MPDVELTQQIKDKAAELGFSRSGICAAGVPARLADFHRWLESGYDGQMRYLSARKEAYEHPRSVLDGARSIVMLTMNYRTNPRRETNIGEGTIASYAWGSGDYHDLIHDRLKLLAAYVRQLAPQIGVRGVVDTAPLLEREFAQLAGLGWVGKNTLLIHPSAGSYFFLAALLLDCDLIVDAPFATDHCGTCRACLDACPTQAFPEPYVLDATRCISYLTIELRDAIPDELRGRMGDWLFGCDVCQDVCPWNTKSPTAELLEFEPRPDSNPRDLLGLFEMSEEAFRGLFRRTALWRAKRRGILRNAAIILGNQCSDQACPALTRGSNDPEPLVREACAWALGRINSPAARSALRVRQRIELDDAVRQALTRALGDCNDP